jgi:transaldolase
MTNGSLPISAGGFSLEKGEMPRQSVYQTVSRPTTSIEQLKQHGQSIWLDFIGRGVIRRGEFERLIADDGPTEVTGNPETFDRVIAEGRDYDDVFEELAQTDSHIDAQAIYERMAIVDVRMAADALQTVFDRTHGVDGFASIGMSPHLAHDTEASIAEARRLCDRVHRPNLMIKVPATREGIPAIEALIAEGINVNVTLVFSSAHYEAVVGAYLRGIERAPDPRCVASVVSVPISRIDSKVDGELLRIGTPTALSLRGKIAIANARRIFRRFCNIFHSDRFASLRLRGVHPQRMLWVSATTENRADSEVRYLEELIGPDTVTSVRLATLDAFGRQGQVRGITLHHNPAEAETALEDLQRVGVDLGTIAEQWQAEIVAALAVSLDNVLTTLARRRSAGTRS